MTVLAVGLTGGLASGKSTVARALAAAGCTVIDADELVADLYAPGGAGAAAVRELFGDDHLLAGGGVDHQRLASLVFADDDARRRLERRIHPLVGERFGEIAAASGGIVVLEATLLVEAGFGERFDVVVTVEAEATTRLERAVARGLTREEARARLDAQGDGSERRAGADIELRNDAGLARLDGAIAALFTDLCRRLYDKQAAGAPG